MEDLTNMLASSKKKVSSRNDQKELVVIETELRDSFRADIKHDH